MPRGFLSADNTAPAQSAAVITPHDSTNFTGGICRSIYVGGAGNMVVVFGDDSTCLFSGIPAGTVIPVEAKRVNSTSTTATLLVALY